MPWENGFFTKLINWTYISPDDTNNNINDIVQGLNQCITKDSASKISADFDFNQKKGKKLADGEALNDAVNLKQLQGTGNYYIATIIETNKARINIAPITELVRGFNFYVSFPENSLNNGAFTITTMSGDTSLGEIRVLDINRNALTGGEITSTSTRHFVYDDGIVGGPAFILNNAEVTNVAATNFSNVVPTIRYVNRYDSNQYGYGIVFNNERFCMQSGYYDWTYNTRGVAFFLPINMENSNFQVSANVQPTKITDALSVVDKDYRVTAFGFNSSDANTTLIYLARNKDFEGDARIAWSVSGIAKAV